MIQPPRGDLVRADLETLASVQFAEFPPRTHGGKIDGEIRQRHLRLKNLPQRIPAKKLRPETVELEFILFHIKRREKRKSLDMVPVVVRDENVRLGIRRCFRVAPAIS